MDGEDDVVQQDRDRTSRMLHLVLRLDVVVEVDEAVVEGVGGEADHVQQQEVEVETDHTGMPTASCLMFWPTFSYGNLEISAGRRRCSRQRSRPNRRGLLSSRGPST